MPTKKSKQTPRPAHNVMQLAAKPIDRERLLAELTTEGLFSNAALTKSYSSNVIGEVGITELVQAMRQTVTAVSGGNLASAEKMLMAQAIALNTIFGELARRSALNMGGHLDASERYMRLALKAQGQCRATLEALADIKHPRPVSFVTQANITTGPQQVNNGLAPAPAGISQTERNELLEHQHGNRLDCGAQGTAGGAHQDMEAMEPVHRATDT